MPILPYSQLGLPNYAGFGMGGQGPGFSGLAAGLDPQALKMARAQALLQIGSSLMGLDAARDPGAALGRGLNSGMQAYQQQLLMMQEMERQRRLDEMRQQQFEMQKTAFGAEQEDRQRQLDAEAAARQHLERQGYVDQYFSGEDAQPVVPPAERSNLIAMAQINPQAALTREADLVTARREQDLTEQKRVYKESQERAAMAEAMREMWPEYAEMAATLPIEHVKILYDMHQADLAYGIDVRRLSEDERRTQMMRHSYITDYVKTHVSDKWVETGDGRSVRVVSYRDMTVVENPNIPGSGVAIEGIYDRAEMDALERYDKNEYDRRLAIEKEEAERAAREAEEREAADRLEVGLGTPEEEKRFAERVMELVDTWRERKYSSPSRLGGVGGGTPDDVVRAMVRNPAVAMLGGVGAAAEDTQSLEGTARQLGGPLGESLAYGAKVSGLISGIAAKEQLSKHGELSDEQKLALAGGEYIPLAIDVALLAAGSAAGASRAAARRVPRILETLNPKTRGRFLSGVEQKLLSKYTRTLKPSEKLLPAGKEPGLLPKYTRTLKPSEKLLPAGKEPRLLPKYAGEGAPGRSGPFYQPGKVTLQLNATEKHIAKQLRQGLPLPQEAKNAIPDDVLLEMMVELAKRGELNLAVYDDAVVAMYKAAMGY